MRKKKQTPAQKATTPGLRSALSRVLGDSERVQDKVERAGEDLSSVNAVLTKKIAKGSPLAKVDLPIEESEAIEMKVQEAATELIAVNDALAEEIDVRRHLEEQLSATEAALDQSRAQEKKSRHNALHDGVTGLPNLTRFNDRLRSALAQARRHNWRLAVMFIDLDTFKSINDTHGHDVGDGVLHIVAQRLLACVRAEDTVSRRSGDEFLMLMVEAGDEANVTAFASRILDTVGQPCAIDGMNLIVKASVGIALYPEGGRSAEDLLKNADEAMYLAKEQKHGPVFYHDR